MERLLRIAKRPAVSTHGGVTARQVCVTMMSEGVGAVVVLEAGKLVGIVSERDIVGRVVVKGLDPDKTLVSEIMTRDVKIASTGMSLEDALELMREGRFRHIPLVGDSGEVIGMFSLRHLLRKRMDDLDQSNADILAYISADGPGG